MNPTFSIVIPSYNRADIIAQTINSVILQEYSDFEILVVDDGSTDNTEEVVLSIKDTRVRYFKKNNAERGAARNFGTKHAKGDYVTFLDSDDRLYKNHLSEARMFILNSKPIIVFQAYEIVGSKTVKKSFPDLQINRRLLKDGNIMSCHGVFLERNFALQNLFNEDYEMSGLEDYELWLRIASQVEIEHNPQITSCLIDHDSRSVVEVNKEKLIKKNELFLDYIFKNENTTRYCQPYRKKIIANVYTYNALHLALSGYRIDAVKYILRTISVDPISLFNRRGLAILKHLILL